MFSTFSLLNHYLSQKLKLIRRGKYRLINTLTLINELSARKNGIYLPLHFQVLVGMPIMPYKSPLWRTYYIAYSLLGSKLSLDFKVFMILIAAILVGMLLVYANNLEPIFLLMYFIPLSCHGGVTPLFYLLFFF
jgi:hypothetical protein